MKRIKKIFSMALALTMLLALSVTASAEGGNFTITAPANGHTYEIYQIFTGDLYEEDGTQYLSNVKWGKNGSGTKNDAVSEDILNKLKNITSTASDQEKLATIKIYVNLSTEAFGTVTNGQPLSAPAGYYLIKDQNGSQAGENGAYTTYIVQLVGNVKITPKVGVPTVEKKVQDTDDTTGTTTDWQDSADYDIEDMVPFQLTAKIGDRYDDYTKYKLVFHDTLSKGLTFDEANNNLTVKVGTKTFTKDTDYTVDVETVEQTGETKLTITITDLKKVDVAVTKGTEVTVEYEAKLNDQAVIGAAGNPNTVYLEYSNNPNDATGNETGHTPEDKVIVFTYEFGVNKKDEAKNPLPGAAFKLEKKVKSGETEKWVIVKEFTVDESDSATTFTFKGLDDGTYRLTETKTPAGYNTIEPIEFTISAEHEADSVNPILKTLTVKVEKDAAQITAEVNSGKLTTDVVNKKGATLPETGGIGTTVFYVVGAILVLGSAVLLITRKRMR